MSRAPRILITGATGNIGSAALASLAGQGVDVIAGLSEETRRTGLPANIECRACNYSNPDQVSSALKGVDSTLLLIPFDEQMVAWGERFVSLAREAGVRFILKISGLGAALDCPSKMGQLHGQIDDAVKHSGISYCVLRCNAFMQNFSGLYGPMIRKKSALYLPHGSARLCFIDTRDIGDVAANILRQPEAHSDRTYDLDGPETLSNSEAMNIVSSIIDRPLEYHSMPAEEACVAYRKVGISEWKIDVLESLAQYIRDGHARDQSHDLQSLLNRPPTTFPRFARDYRDAWFSK